MSGIFFFEKPFLLIFQEALSIYMKANNAEYMDLAGCASM